MTKASCALQRLSERPPVAAWLIANRKVNTLVLVHRQQLLDQWHERLAMFLNLPAKSLGQIGGGKMDRTGRVDIAVIQSLHRKEEVKDFVAEYGQVIVDECHHISAFTFEQVMKQVKAKYVVGLTATPTRKDGHHPIIYMQCGPARFSMSARTMTETSPFGHKVIPRYTEFRTRPELTDITIQDVYAALVDDAARNEMIAADLIRAVETGRSPLLLTGRTEHLQYFAARLENAVKHVFVLKGGMGKKQRRTIAEALASVAENQPRVILATGSYIGEGFDDARLDTLFLAMPISWKGTLQQYVGRLHRLHDNKRVVQVYDYVDDLVPMLARMYERRLKGYSAIGYTIDQEGPAADWLMTLSRYSRTKSGNSTIERCLFVFVVCVLVCTYTWVQRNARGRAALVPDGDTGSLAGRCRISVLTKKPLYSKALPALRIRPGARELCAVWPQGESPVFDLCARRVG